MTICWALCLHLRLSSTRGFGFSLHSGVNLVETTFSEEPSCLSCRSTLDSSSVRFTCGDNSSLTSCYVSFLNGRNFCGLIICPRLSETRFSWADSSVRFASSDAPTGMASLCRLYWLGHCSTDTSSRRFLIGLSCSRFGPHYSEQVQS
jgi:hypothetical protein